MRKTVLVCDLCNKERNESDILRLFIKGGRYIDASGNYDTQCADVDICKVCVILFIKDKLEAFQTFFNFKLKFE